MTAFDIEGPPGVDDTPPAVSGVRRRGLRAVAAQAGTGQRKAVSAATPVQHPDRPRAQFPVEWFLGWARIYRPDWPAQ